MQQNKTIIITPKEISFQSIPSKVYIQLRNITQKSLWYRLFLTNPDNYSLSSHYGTINPLETSKIWIEVKMYQSITPFNYIKNKITIIIAQNKSDAITPISDRYTQYPLKDMLIYQHLIKVNMHDQRPLGEDSLRKLKKLIKIFKHSPGSITDFESDFMRNYCNNLGNVLNMKICNNFVKVEYAQPVSIEPKIMYIKRDLFISSLFSFSYFSVLTGSQKQKKNSGIQLNKVAEIEAPPQIRQILSFENIVVCRTDVRLYIFNTDTQQSVSRQHQNFRIILFRPYLCVVLEGKYMIFYQNFEQLSCFKIKVKKLLLRCVCRLGNQLYLAGRNFSKVPMKLTTNRREIYIVSNFDIKNNYIVPNKTIQLPKSPNQVEILQVQNPFLLAYCRPNIYLIDLHNLNILVKLERDLLNLHLIQGRYSYSLLNCIGISSQSTLLKINFDKFATIFGVEVNESNQDARAVCQIRDGRVFYITQHSLNQYHASKQKNLHEQILAGQHSELLLLRTNHKGQLIIYRRVATKYLIEIYTTI